MTLAPPPTEPSPCCNCGSSSIAKLITKSSNQKGNAGRPYYKCETCTEFLGFVDFKGNGTDNPPCDCGVSSKMQIAGSERRVSRGLHFVCRLARCDFYAPLLREDGNQATAGDEDIAEVLERLGF